ncbi:MAG: DUF2970 domain-containing protein [Halioglobus sp.]|jgi:hypothetical protein
MEKTTSSSSTQTQQEASDLTLTEVVGSVFAAGLGVQSRENKVRDFSRGKPVQFIIAGLLFTGMFLLALVAVVNVVV